MNNVTVKTTDWQMTDELSACLDEKIAAIEKLLRDPESETVRCNVELSAIRDQHATRFRAEMTLTENGRLYRAEARGGTMRDALDQLKEGIQQQLRKSKQKHVSFLRRGGLVLKRWSRFGRE
ncbi:MAG TPA: HPF/RaiA family ribosome-associated protein [Candidatus Paceibacterota bacterium]|nr:HPF/RaiA family ribosome-associated protein [Candidatus Paceibacterota bacterium]